MINYISNIHLNLFIYSRKWILKIEQSEIAYHQYRYILSVRCH